MSRKTKFVESERSPSVVSSIWQQKIVLQRNLSALENNQKMVVNRITLNQRTTFKDFKKKLHQAKVSHARIMGDREAEKGLRDRSGYQGSHLNTNLGLDPEDEEVLKKIWSRGARDRENFSAALESGKLKSPASGARLIKSAPAARSRLLSQRSADPRASTRTRVRPQTVAATEFHPPAAQLQLPDNASGVYISTGHSNINSPNKRPGSHRDNEPRQQFLAVLDAEHELSDLENFSEEGGSGDEGNDTLFTSSRSKSRRRSARIVTPSSDKLRETASVEPPKTSTIFDDDNKQSRLLEVHKQRVKSANYEGRVRKLCDTLTPYQADGRYVLRDYYQNCMVADAAAVKRTAARACHVPITSEAEIVRSVGNLGVKCMTLKKLNFDFPPPVVKRDNFMDNVAVG